MINLIKYFLRKKLKIKNKFNRMSKKYKTM